MPKQLRDELGFAPGTELELDAVAAARNRVLLTLDRRAQATYQRLGVEFRDIAS